MSEIISGAAIPDDVMREAVEAGFLEYWGTSGHNPNPSQADHWMGVVLAVLPILTPAIEHALLTRIADDAHAKGMEYLARNGLDTGAEEMFEREEWIRSYIPTEDEEATK